MRICSIILCCCLGLTILPAQPLVGWEKYSEDVQRYLTSAESSPLPVYVMASEGLDFPALEAVLQREKADLRSRTSRVIRHLQNETSQFANDMRPWIQAQGPASLQDIQFFWISKSFFISATPAQLKSLAALPEIGYIMTVPEPILLKAREVPPPPLPDDREIGHDAIGAPALWKMGYTGNGRKVLVIDTGTDGQHPALWENFQGRFVPEAEAWFNPAGARLPEDCGTHGTHVTGTVVGLDRSRRDTIGVAFNGTWMAAPAISCAVPFDIIEVLQWALDPDGDPNTIEDMPDVINNSWGVRNPSANNCLPNPFIDAIDALETAGVALVFAAGNDSLPQSVNFPGNLARGTVNTMAIGAIDPKDVTYPIAAFSSQGPTICQTTPELEIKPEVVAPGVTTRSARSGGGYTWFAGTSMATPHVAGAIMLLKEAFPTLTGSAIKLALYRSAMDLGAPGEDNVYGQGIIQLKAAFDSLVADGYQPVSVPVSRNPGISGQPSQGFCGLPAVVEFSLHNYGQGALNAIGVRYQWDDQATADTLLWQGGLPVSDELSWNLPARALSPGLYKVKLEVITANGEPDYFFLDNLLEVDVLVQPAVSFTMAADPACAGSGALLEGIASDSTVQAQWYDSPTGGQMLGQGPQWVSPPLLEADTFYLGAAYRSQVGLPDNSAGTGTYDPGNSGSLRFDNHYPLRLEAVSVYGLIAGEQRIVLWDDQGVEIAARNVPLGTGWQRVQLDFDIPVGEDLRLGLDSSSTGGLYYSISEAQFPYTHQGLISIKDGLDGPASKGFFYYFYNWEISFSSPCDRLEVPVSLGQGEAVADFEMNSDIVDLSQNPVVQFMDSSEGAESWFWTFGDGGNATDPNPSHTYDTPGLYTVSLQITTAEGCTAAASRALEVFNQYGNPVSNTSLQSPALKLRLFPNPATFRVTFDFGGKVVQPERWMLRDLQGRVVANGQLSNGPDVRWEIDLPNMAQGLYLFQVEHKGQRSAQTIYIQQP